MGLRRVDHHHYTLKTLTLPSTGQGLMDKTVGDAADPNTAQGRCWLSSDGPRLSLSRVIHSLYKAFSQHPLTVDATYLILLQVKAKLGVSACLHI